MNEYAKVTIIGAKPGDWFKPLEGQTVLAVVEFSIFNGERRLFAARLVELPEELKKHKLRPIYPTNILIS